MLAALLKDTGRPILAIHASAADRHRSALDVASFVASLSESSGRESLSPSSRVLEFPSEQPVSWHGGRHREHDAERALCCHRLLTGEAVAVMTTPAALSLPLLPPREFRARTLSLAPGQSIEREALLEALERARYERVDAVTEVGQWSLRGGIVDVFSPTHERPVRAEFFGDEVESLRVFDPTSQRSVEPVKELAVLPLVGERERTAALTAYLPGDALVVLEDPALLDAPPDDAPAAEPLGTLLVDFQRLELPLLAGPTSAGTRVTMGTRSVGGFRGQFKEMAAEIRGWRGEGFAVRLVVDDERQAERLRRMLSEHELEAWPGVTLWSSEGLGVVVGECAAGFQLPALGLVVLSEQEVFGAQRRRLRRPAFQRGAAIAAFTDLAPNDLVVHEMHGIARYHGLRTLETDGRDADFLLLEYADGGRLYLPVERLDLISKYMGAPDGAARLDRLGGVAWGRVKDSVRAALRAMAEELLRLYAARSVVERSILRNSDGG